MSEIKSYKIILHKKTNSRKIKVEKKNYSYSATPTPVIITTETYSKFTKAIEGKNKKENRMLINSKGIDYIPEEAYKTHSEGKYKPEEELKKIEIPDGYSFKETRHFYIYTEGDKIDEEVVKKIEYLHGEIMLDLIAFSPWTRDTKVHIYLSKTPESYQKISGRPPWSGGAANLRQKKIYLYLSREWYGILAHELTHIYFDSFFGGYDKSPLWLSEGMAVYIQVQRAGAYPNWLKDNIQLLKKGEGYSLNDLVRIKTLEDADSRSVKLWYAQSYTLVYFLLHIQRGDSFYQFCKNLKEGKNISRALSEAYGKPYTTLKRLEVIWRQNLNTQTIVKYDF